MLDRLRDIILVPLVFFACLVLAGLILGGLAGYESSPFVSVIFTSLFIILFLMLLVWLLRKVKFVRLFPLLWKLFKYLINIPSRRKYLKEQKEQIRLYKERQEASELREYCRNQALKSEISSYLQKALEKMDSTHRWFTNEDEANRELVSCLKTMNLEVEYQHRLPNGRTVDARVGDIFIEGKLSPYASDIDRLLGQLSVYTEYGNQVNIVVYGKLREEEKKRVINEIFLRYPNQVFLTYLDNPNRQRRSQGYYS